MENWMETQPNKTNAEANQNKREGMKTEITT